MVRLVSSAGQVTILPVRKLSAVSPASSGSMPKTFACGLSCLTAAATPLSRPPPETGDEHEIDVGQLLDDLEAAGSLPRDDLLVVVGRDDDVAVLADQLLRPWPDARSRPRRHRRLQRPSPAWRRA